jgi:hypothetical protein
MFAPFDFERIAALSDLVSRSIRGHWRTRR